MDSSNAEKAWDTVAQTREFMGCALGGQAHHAFMAGRAYRDAEVTELTAENERLRENRGWDGEWRTLHQTEEQARRVLMTWTKAQLVNHHVADWQRQIQNENWVADRLVKMTAERDALRKQLDALAPEAEED